MLSSDKLFYQLHPERGEFVFQECTKCCFRHIFLSFVLFFQTAFVHHNLINTSGSKNFPLVNLYIYIYIWTNLVTVDLGPS